MRSCSDPEPPRKEDHRNRMNEKLKEKVKESLSSVLPITLIVLVLSITLVPMEIGTLALFLTGAVLLIFGMGFFQLGAEMSMTPLGEGVGKTLAKREKVILVVLVSFALGTIITIAEPDLQVLANQVASIPNNVLIWTVAVGVGVFLALAVLRIFYRASLAKCLLIAYALLFALTLFSPKDFLAVAFDAGGVTTGPITVPFIMALGVGVSALRAAQGHDDDSFGLVALCSVGPILMVLLLGIFYHPSDDGIRIVSSVSCTYGTGAEMEALTCASVAALTVYDMLKAADKSMIISDVMLLSKSGGKSGDYNREL